jgi:hypothetical protein
MFRVLALAALLCCPAVALSQGAKDDQPNKEKPKKAKKETPATPGIPDFEKIVPPNATPEQREMMRKMYDEMKKQMAKHQRPGGPGGFPGGVAPPGGNFPGGKFPGGKFPGGAFPGGRFPAGGFQGMAGMMGMGFAMTSPRLGAAMEPASPTLLHQLDLPDKQGIVLRDLKKASPADKAGIKNHDILIELNGKPVPNRMDEMFKLLTAIKADEKVEAVVVRKGKKVNIKELTLPEGQNFGGPAGFPGGAFTPPAGFRQPPAPPNPPGARNLPGKQEKD